MKTQIRNTKDNHRAWRAYASEALKRYTPVMGWLLYDDEDKSLHSIEEAQGQTSYVGRLEVLDTFGDVYSAHGQGGKWGAGGARITTQRAFFEALNLEWID